MHANPVHAFILMLPGFNIVPCPSQATRGVEIFSHKWEDSGHCEHYRRYPHEYAFQVSQFTNNALKDW